MQSERRSNSLFFRSAFSSLLYLREQGFFEKFYKIVLDSSRANDLSNPYFRGTLSKTLGELCSAWLRGQNMPTLTLDSDNTDVRKCKDITKILIILSFVSMMYV